MLSRTTRIGYNFSILNAFKGLKDILRAPVKHVKSYTEASGSYFHTQTNTTEEAFDEVSHEWQVKSK